MKQYNVEDIRAAQNEAHALIAALEILAQNPEHASLERIRTHRDSTYNAVNKALGTKKHGSRTKVGSQLLDASRKHLLSHVLTFVFNNDRPTQIGELVLQFALPMDNIKSLVRQLTTAGLVVYRSDEAVEMISGLFNHQVKIEHLMQRFNMAFDAPLLQE